MPILTDRQRIELAVPAYLLYALTGAPGVFVPADPDLRARAEADIAELRGNLLTACLEPMADLTPAKGQALIRRLERIKRQVTADWHERPALGLMLMLWCFLKDLTDREVLILWEGSAMDPRGSIADRQLSRSRPSSRQSRRAVVVPAECLDNEFFLS